MLNRAFKYSDESAAASRQGMVLKGRHQSTIFYGQVEIFGIKKFKLFSTPKTNKCNIRSTRSWPVMALTAGCLGRD